MANIQGDTKKSEMSPETIALIAQVVGELRKPNEVEQAKLDDERNKREEAKRQSVDLSKAEMQAIENRRRNCPHYRKIGGQVKHSWRGQVSSGDGMVRACCVQCQTEAPMFKAYPGMIQNGVNLEDQPADWNWFAQLHKATFPEGCDRGLCPVCHPKK